MRKAIVAVLLFFPGLGRGDTLRPPAGEALEREGTTTVALGFGTVSFPTLAPAPAPAPAAAPGRKLACNRGTFSLRYGLVKTGRRIAARGVRVAVKNAADFFAAPTPALEEHERGHQRINEAAAPRIEKALAAFSVEGRSLREAERLLKESFRRELKAVEALHRDWDDNSVFVSPAP